MPCLFALDQNFPQPIVGALGEFIRNAELVPIGDIDPLLAEIDDWQVLLALHHHERPWAGLITTDARMLRLPREMAVLRQTNLTLVVAQSAGDDPIRATGLLFTHLSWICHRTTDAEPQVWVLKAKTGSGIDPMTFLEKIADHQNRDVDRIWQEERLTVAELAIDPLAH